MTSTQQCLLRRKGGRKTLTLWLNPKDPWVLKDAFPVSAPESQMQAEGRGQAPQGPCRSGVVEWLLAGPPSDPLPPPEPPRGQASASGSQGASTPAHCSAPDCPPLMPQRKPLSPQGAGWSCPPQQSVRPVRQRLHPSARRAPLLSPRRPPLPATAARPAAHPTPVGTGGRDQPPTPASPQPEPQTAAPTALSLPLESPGQFNVYFLTPCHPEPETPEWAQEVGSVSKPWVRVMPALPILCQPLAPVRDPGEEPHP